MWCDKNLELQNIFFFFLMEGRPPKNKPFPSTTLFRYKKKKKNEKKDKKKRKKKKKEKEKNKKKKTDRQKKNPKKHYTRSHLVCRLLPQKKKTHSYHFVFITTHFRLYIR